jgi:hypothetical protein
MLAGCHTNVAISLIDKEISEESGKLVSNILRENILFGQGPGFSNPDNEEISLEGIKSI